MLVKLIISSILIFIFPFLTYGIYYSYLFNLIKNKKNATINKKYQTKISLIIPTYNEEASIKGKLINLIEQTYPFNFVEIIIIDSASTDSTVEIVKKFQISHPEINIKLIEEDKRRGKSEAINKAFFMASSDSKILVMSDADIYLDKDALERIISHFIDPKIGAVCGRGILMNLKESKEIKNEIIYRNFYEILRIGESTLDSTPIFNGELAAYRRAVIEGEKVRENLNADDSQLAVIVRRKGFKSIYDYDTIFYEYSATDKKSKRKQQIRRGQGLVRLFWYNKDMLFKDKYGKFGLIILPINFLIYVISPFLISTFLLLFFINLFLYLYNYFSMKLVILSSIILIPFVILNCLPTKRYFNIIWIFLEYQIILLKAIFLYIGGKSLHIWEKIEKKNKKLLS